MAAAAALFLAHGALAQQSPAQARRSAGRSFEGTVVAINPAGKSFTLKTSAGDVAIRVTDESDLHLMRPGDKSSITTGCFALVTGAFSADRTTIVAKGMSLYYKQGGMVEYISGSQVRGQFKRQGAAMTIQANGKLIDVQLATPLMVLTSQPLQLGDIKAGDKASTWVLETDEGNDAQVVFVERR